MRLLFVNPNSTDSMTDKVRQTARNVLPSTIDVVACSNLQGPASIQGAADGELAIPGMLNVIRGEIERGLDGIVIACFDDAGIDDVFRKLRR